MHYGEEYRRKWQGFSPREMAEIWSRKFEGERIHPTVVVALGDSLIWEHPPTLPTVVDALHQLQDRMARDRQASTVRLPAPSECADPSSPTVQAALAEMRRFVASKRFPKEAA